MVLSQPRLSTRVDNRGHGTSELCPQYSRDIGGLVQNAYASVFLKLKKMKKSFLCFKSRTRQRRRKRFKSSNLNSKLKRKALGDPCEKPCKIIQRKLRERDVSTLTTTDVNRIRKNIHYARSSIIPKLSKHLEELHLALTNLGYRFHLGQLIWRKIQSLVLSAVFKNKSEVGKFLKLFFGLSFLKPDDVS
ncbi:hypothetical protein QTP88_004802 [Uroleucon formosanum]